MHRSLILPLLLSLSSLALPQEIVQVIQIPLEKLVSDTLNEKVVVAHFIVGNTYNYIQSNWAKDIILASSKGFDGFALNVGIDNWQPARVADAYAAAANSGTAFKLFLSFDMTSLPCAQMEDSTILRQYISNYSQHQSQFSVGGKPMVSTFSGEQCEFGMPSVDDGWHYALKNSTSNPVHFIPAFFDLPATLTPLTVIDGAFNWNAAWPIGKNNATFDSDNEWIDALNGRDYMAGVSPWFFTHYGANSYNKNFILRGDDWLIANRWELLVQHRNRISLAQVITWNDYGESHYVGPIEGMQPMSQAWTDGFDHQGWLDLIHYYIQVFKTGIYPPPSEDRLFLWARLYPASATARSDAVGIPEHADDTLDYVWAVVFLISPAHVSLSCGASHKTVMLEAGISKVQLPLISSCNVEASIVRFGITVVAFKPSGFSFNTDPVVYNFNAFVAASPSATLQ
ncbi:glycoside hydrolase family 71 protein [Hygrophoropsis aurantiaca]|uniref:Glycoside hydrolase family 71 protein n=1 Tax=Hygrophoropsis aurantiaca TaxID=72124 RepID=A0ACB8A5G3_9AGAM|nr:glycoside hydrolase family 71 protein [Hygrophoropsis aurantiaca]